MHNPRPIHPDFLFYLEFKNQELIELYKEVRANLLAACPDCYEILYNTHALTSVYSLSEKLTDAFCMIPIYSNHLNLGFHKGTLLADPYKLLSGTGKLIRHIPISKVEDMHQNGVGELISTAIVFAQKNQKNAVPLSGKTISKIKI